MRNAELRAGHPHPICNAEAMYCRVMIRRGAAQDVLLRFGRVMMCRAKAVNAKRSGAKALKFAVLRGFERS